MPVSILHFSGKQIFREVRYTWPFINSHWKISCGNKPGDVAGQPVCNAFQTMNSKTSHPMGNVSCMLSKEELYPSRKLHSVRPVELLTGCKFLAFRNYRLSWLFHYWGNITLPSITRSSSPGGYNFAAYFVQRFFGSLCFLYDCLSCMQVVRPDRPMNRKNIWRRSWSLTTFCL